MRAPSFAVSVRRVTGHACPAALTLLLLSSPSAHAQSTAPPGPAPPPATSDPDEARPIRIGPVLLTGYIQYDFLAALTDDRDVDDTFRFRRVRAQLAGPVNDDIGWAVSAEATNTPVLRDAYVTLKYLPAATVRIGQFVMPYGYERYVESSNRLEFTERIFTSLATGRDAGIAVSNEDPFWGWLSYGAAIANGTGQNVADDNDAKDVLGRLAVTPAQVPGFEVGFNAARGEQPEGLRARTGADVSYETRRVHLAAEFLRETLEKTWRRQGMYAFGSWRWYPRAATRGLHHLELAARVARLSGSEPATRQVDLAVNYYIRRTLRLMVDVVTRSEPHPDLPGAVLHARLNVTF